MLDLGFLPDVEKIFTSTPNRQQTMLFSATMPGDIIALARRFMNQPVHIRTQDNEDEGGDESDSDIISNKNSNSRSKSSILRKSNEGKQTKRISFKGTLKFF